MTTNKEKQLSDFVKEPKALLTRLLKAQKKGRPPKYLRWVVKDHYTEESRVVLTKLKKYEFHKGKKK